MSSMDGKLQKANPPQQRPTKYAIGLYFRTNSQLFEAKQLNQYRFTGD